MFIKTSWPVQNGSKFTGQLKVAYKLTQCSHLLTWLARLNFWPGMVGEIHCQEWHCKLIMSIRIKGGHPLSSRAHQVHSTCPCGWLWF